MASAKTSLALVDQGGEVSRAEFYTGALDITGNFVAVQADANAIRTAIDALTLCNEGNMSQSVVLHEANGAAPSNVLAQREFGIRIFYTDTGGNKGHITIPGPDLSLVTVTNDGVSLSAGTVMPALVTALQDHGRSKQDLAITVTGARIVGRNN